MRPAGLVLSFLGIAALVLFVSQPAWADKTHEGVVIEAGNGKLLMAREGKEHSHVVPPNAQITLDGEKARLDDLKASFLVHVTTTDDLKTVLRIDARTKK